uniref:Macaca fascicularis brain cDNA, clone: QflA-18618 n=1 Tax=Macaca fascicularis TaxID=9541 RepID=I7GIB4_MACFA|nr:unnamed protein product [Macaca fascicularis]
MLCLCLDFGHTFRVLLANHLWGRGGAAVVWPGCTFGTFSLIIPARTEFLSAVSFISMDVQRRRFFFFFLLFFSSWDVDATKMHRYCSARVPGVCIEFQSWII